MNHKKTHRQQQNSTNSSAKSKLSPGKKRISTSPNVNLPKPSTPARHNSPLRKLNQSANRKQLLQKNETPKPGDETVAKAAAAPQCSASDIHRVSKELRKYIKTRRNALEKAMFDKFYRMRIVQSRQFIDLIERIDRSCSIFVEAVRLFDQGVYGDGDHDPTVLSKPSNASVIPQDDDASNPIEEDLVTIPSDFDNTQDCSDCCNSCCY